MGSTPKEDEQKKLTGLGYREYEKFSLLYFFDVVNKTRHFPFEKCRSKNARMQLVK